MGKLRSSTMNLWPRDEYDWMLVALLTVGIILLIVYVSGVLPGGGVSTVVLIAAVVGIAFPVCLWGSELLMAQRDNRKKMREFDQFQDDDSVYIAGGPRPMPFSGSPQPFQPSSGDPYGGYTGQSMQTPVRQRRDQFRR